MSKLFEDLMEGLDDVQRYLEGAATGHIVYIPRDDFASEGENDAEADSSAALRNGKVPRS